jgi:hypothetical protein
MTSMLHSSEQAHRATFNCHGSLPHKISSEAARWCALNRSAVHQDEASYDSDCDAAAADDDHDGGLQDYMRGIVGQAMRARLTGKFKLLQDVDCIVVKDKLRRRASTPGLVVKRIEEGSQGHYPLQRAESCADQASSSAAAAEVESQAPSLPAIEIDAGFFKSYAQRIKKQREMLRCSSGL